VFSARHGKFLIFYHHLFIVYFLLTNTIVFRNKNYIDVQ